MFNDVVDLGYNVTLICKLLFWVGDDFRNAERGGMEWCLRNETIWERYSEESCDTGREAEEEDVPVEASGFSKRKLGSLSY